MFEKRKILLLLLLWSSFRLKAQQQPAPIVLDSIVLEAFRIPTQKNNLPFSVTEIEFSTAQPNRSTVSIDPYLATVPGVFVQNSSNFAQDSRIAIRGFGSRAAFGIRGIQLIVDGIPETTPDGQGQVDNLTLALLQKIEVLRGPQAALYGNASGGVLLINTIDSLAFGKTELQLRLGSFGLQQQYLTYNHKSNRSQWVAHLGRTALSGYRNQSGMESRQLQIKGKTKAKNTAVWRWQFNYTDSPFAEDAGGLTIEEVNQNRRQARQRNVDFSTQEDVRQLKSGFQYTQEKAGLIWQLYGFGSVRDFEAYLPFSFGGVVELNRFYTGQGGYLQWGGDFGNSSLNLQWGYDFAFQNDRRKRFVNIEGTQGDVTLQQKEQFLNAATYFLMEWKTKRFDVLGGLRQDWNTLVVKDQFISNGDASDQLVLNTLNPSLGIAYRLYPNWQFFSNISSAFETPSLSELSADPENRGGFNTQLEAQKTQSMELGLRFSTAVTQIDLVAYWMQSKGELTPYELAAFPGRTFYQNAGRSSRRGAELFMVQKWSPALKTTLSYTYSNFNFERFITSNNIFSGNQLPGIPKHFGAMQLLYSKNNLLAQLGWRYTGSFFADNANQTLVDSWHLINLNIEYTFGKKTVHWIPSLGIQNLNNQMYFDNIRLNTFGKRFYEPAATRNLFVGIKVQWE